MDWRAVTFDWNRARAFLVTAEEGSLSAAARALGLTQPTVGRQVSALEEELGILLFDRSGRGLVLTPTGLDLLEEVRAMGQAAGRFSLAAAGQSQSVDGQICITASEVIAAYLLPPIVQQIRTQHPGIEVEIVASNKVQDLSRREADIAVRSVRPTSVELVARKLTDSQAGMYASPDYLDRIGPIREPADLSRAAFMGFDRTSMMIDGLNAMGLSLTMDNFPIVTSNHLVQWQLCKQGAGICLMMEQIGDAEPAVQRVLPDFPALPVPMWLTSHRELKTSRRVRVVFELLAEGLTSGSPQG